MPNTSSARFSRSRRMKQHFSFDHLEDRCLLANSANVLVVDFTTPGGVIPLSDGGFIPASSFADQFPNQAAAQRAVRKIGQRLELLFKELPDPPQLILGGLTDRGGFDLGLSRLLYSREQDGRLTDVIYASGQNFTISPAIIGLAFQAPVGSNLEHYGFAFTANMNFDLRQGPPLGKRALAAAKQAIIVQVSNVIAHEYGHLLGLGHVQTAASLMNPTIPGSHARFIDTTFIDAHLTDSATFTCGTQNQVDEFKDSFDNQTVYPGSNHWRYRRGTAGGPPPVATPPIC